MFFWLIYPLRLLLRPKYGQQTTPSKLLPYTFWSNQIKHPPSQTQIASAEKKQEDTIQSSPPSTHNISNSFDQTRS